MSEVHTLVRALKEQQLTLALAESVTCGMVAYKLSNVKGISDVLKGGIVCYSPDVKNNLLEISKKLIDECTCESQEVTEAMARKLPKLIQADIHVAVTGLASSNGSESKKKPVGSAFIAIRYKNKIYNYRKNFRGTPVVIKNKICIALFECILDVISS